MADDIPITVRVGKGTSRRNRVRGGGTKGYQQSATPAFFPAIGANGDSPYVDDPDGNFAEAATTGGITGANVVGAVVGVLTVLVVGLAVGYGVWIHLVQNDVGALQKVIIFNPNIPFLDVYIDPLNGNDQTGDGTAAKPFLTLGRALTRVAECTGTRATIHIIGAMCGISGALDLGMDPSFDFFPATAQYAEVVVRGTRLNEIITSVLGVSELPGANKFVQVVTSTGGLVPNIYQNNFVEHVEDNRRYVIEDNTINALDVVGGNVQDVTPATGVQPPGGIAFRPGDVIRPYTICNAITWRGTLQLNHSYSRVCFEDIHIIPGDGASTWYNPPLRDDAVVFRGARLDVLGTAQVDINDDTGLPEFTNLNATYHGSMTLEGVYINGAGVTNAAFNALSDNVCARMISALVNEAAVFYTDTCSAFFVSFRDVRSGDTMTVASGEFRGHGLKFRATGPAQTIVPRCIHLGGASMVHLTNIDAEGEYTRAIDADTSAFGIISGLRADLTNSPLAGQPVLNFGEAGMFGVREVDLTGGVCMTVIGSSKVNVWQEFTCVPTVGQAINIALDGTVDFNPINQFPNGTIGPLPWSTITMTTAFPVVTVTDGLFNLARGADALAWTTLDGIPLVRLNRGGRFLSFGALELFNQNPNNANWVFQVGVNNPTPGWTQDDYLHPSSERCEALGVPPPTDPEVWIDAATGADTNPGSAAEPLATLAQAISVLSQRSGSSQVCTINIVGALDLGADPVICTSPLQKVCKHIIITGAETVVGSGTIDAAIVNIAPGGRNWKQITDTTAAFTPSAFIKAFIRNTNQNRVFVVEDNAATTIDTIAGTVQRGPPPLPTPPVPVPESVSWTNGDSFTVFTLTSSITWTGALVLDIPYNGINFESIHFVPGAAGSTLWAPNGPEPKVTFKGCEMDARSTDQLQPSYIGSMLLLGVYGEGTAVGAYFTSFQVGRCIQSESMWIDQARLFYTGACAALFLKSTASPAVGLEIQAAATFVGLGIYIMEPAFNGALVSDASTVHMNFLQVEVTTGAGLTTMTVATESTANFLTMTLTCGGATCVNGLVLTTGSETRVTGSATITAPQAFALDSGAEISILFGPTLSGFVAATPPILAQFGTTVTISSPSWIIDLDTPGIMANIIVCDGCELNMGGLAVAYTWGTPTGFPLIGCTDGALARGAFSGTLINNGPSANPLEVIKCGGNAITDWALAENDLALAPGVTTGCNCAR